MDGNGCFTKRSFEKWLFRRVVVPGTSHHLFSQHEKKKCWNTKASMEVLQLPIQAMLPYSSAAPVVQSRNLKVPPASSQGFCMRRRQQTIHIFRPCFILPCILLGSQHASPKKFGRKKEQPGISFSNMCSFHGDGTPSLCSAFPGPGIFREYVPM